MTDARKALVEKVARAICQEQCAFFGEPPCWQVGEGFNPQCDEPGCEALAEAAIAVVLKRAARMLEKTADEAVDDSEARGFYSAAENIRALISPSETPSPGAGSGSRP